MKKVVSVLFVASMLVFAACQSKPKADETTTETNTMLTDTTTMAMDSAAAMPADSSTMMSSDSVK